MERHLDLGLSRKGSTDSMDIRTLRRQISGKGKGSERPGGPEALEARADVGAPEATARGSAGSRNGGESTGATNVPSCRRHRTMRSRRRGAVGENLGGEVRREVQQEKPRGQWQ